MLGPTVGEIVAIDRGHHDMVKPELGDGVGDPRRLAAVERAGKTRADVAERAGPRAGVAHDHEGGVLLLPAFADIGAARLLADSGELVLAHDRAGRRICGRSRRFDADPLGLACDRLIRPVRLFRVARPQGARIVV
jgi:hypothetical protein